MHNTLREIEITTPLPESVLSMNGWDGERIAPDPVRVNGGDDTFSYKKNSYYQVYMRVAYEQ